MTDRTARDWHVTGSPSTAVVDAVAAVRGVDPLSLCPLVETLDADALDALFTDDLDADLSVAFEYGGCEVTVDADGTVVAQKV